MKRVAIIDHMGGADYRIVPGYLADLNHAVYAQDGRLFLVRVERLQDALYIEERETAVITLSNRTSVFDIAEIVARLKGMTAWDWLTQEALNFNGQLYDFHMR